MDILIRHATIATDGIELTADLAVKDGVVRAIGNLEGVSAATVIEAQGKLVLPGAIDIGLHLLDDGSFDPESDQGFARASRDAALGGVTTLVSTIEVDAREDFAKAVKSQEEADEKRSPIDFGYHLLVGDWSEGFQARSREALAAGICSFYARRNEGPNLPSPTLLYAIANELSEDSLLVTSPFDAALFAFEARRYAGDQSWKELLHESIEVAQVAALPHLLARARCHVLMLGISTAGSVAALRSVRDANPNIQGACYLPHLLLRDQPGAPRTWPPLREKGDVEALFQGLEDGTLSAIASGHKPRGHSEIHSGAVGRVPLCGLATLSHYYPGLHSEGLAKWRLSAAALSQAAAADPAKLAGLYPRKGTLQPGADADFVIIDPNRARETRGGTETSPVDFADPLARESYVGAIDAVYCRGRKVVEGMTLKESGGGKFLNRRLALRK